MVATELFARRATLARSLRLLSAFRFEQSDPDRFYGALADDTVSLVADLWTGVTGTVAAGRTVLDVGGGPGYFADAFADTWYIGLEPNVSEMSAAGLTGYGAVRGDGTALPFRDSSFDVVYSSNVAEHIPNWQAMGEEMLRVTKPGGLTILSYTVWLGPFGGHETGLWQHYIGGDFARRHYEKKHGHPPKNVWGTSLFAVSAREGLSWARHMDATGRAELIAALPRYHPRWAWWVTHVPVLREFAVSNLVLVLRPPAA